MDVLIFGACFAIIALASKQIGHGLMKTGLPLISGFLLTGIITGPYVLNLITSDAVLNLRFVDEISLGLIAFAAGSELFLKELKSKLKSIAWVTTGLVFFTFSLTATTFYCFGNYIPFMKSMEPGSRLAISLLAGAIMVARSPSSAIAIVNELRARGQFTQTVLGVTVLMDVVVIILFATNSSIADAIFSGLEFSFGFVLLLVAEIGASVIIGYFVSRVILAVLMLPFKKFLKTGLILLTGYLVFILSAWLRHYTSETFSFEILLEPLLICMIAGFLLSNTTRFRKEFSRLLYDIGPPVYIAFFTLTGASLSLDILVQTWPIALALFLTRGFAVFLGSFTGGMLAKNPMKTNFISGMAFITQAGVGLGLAKEVAVEFPEWGNPFSTIIISIIILNQIIGPLLFKSAIKMMKEDHSRASGSEPDGIMDAVIIGSDGQANALAVSLMSQGWDVKMAVINMNNSHGSTPVVEPYQLSEISIEELKKINTHHASAIVVMLTDDDNYKICEIAYEHFGTQTVIARLNDRNNYDRFQTLGVLIVDPSTAIVSLLNHFVKSPGAASLLMGMHEGQNIVDIYIKNPNLFGIALKDIRLPFDTIIMSVKRRGVLIIPHAYTRLEAGDLITVVGSLKSIKETALKFDSDQDEALFHIVEKTASKELETHSAKTKVKDFITSDICNEKDRFDLLVENSLVMDLKQTMDKETFFEMVSKTMSASLNMPSSILNDMLLKREMEATTVLAPGLAIPHIIIEGERKFSILIARCKKGIEFTKSAPRVYAAFVMVGTKDERNFHLYALSAIAQIVMDTKFENKWLRARSASALQEVIISADRNREITKK